MKTEFAKYRKWSWSEGWGPGKVWECRWRPTLNPKKLSLLFVWPKHYSSALLCYPTAGPNKWEAKVIQGRGLVSFVSEQEWMGVWSCTEGSTKWLATVPQSAGTLIMSNFFTFSDLSQWMWDSLNCVKGVGLCRLKVMGSRVIGAITSWIVKKLKDSTTN